VLRDIASSRVHEVFVAHAAREVQLSGRSDRESPSSMARQRVPKVCSVFVSRALIHPLLQIRQTSLVLMVRTDPVFASLVVGVAR
jgi:hypothetical protein